MNKDFKDLSEVSVTSLNFPPKMRTRVLNVFSRMGIENLAQLCANTERDLFMQERVGRAVIDEVQISLSELGLSLRRMGEHGFFSRPRKR